MENNLNNPVKIGCQAGRTKIVDPNDFDGFNSESNISVPLEDLNISVVLKTFRKGRTVLFSASEGNSTGSKESSETLTINFINGGEVSGKKVLTTSYTDLTVLGSDSNNEEALGITNIDIDFNSSMAPMVNIDFVDVRGSAIFQNDFNISENNTNNKYSTFFQLPYPKFELEIKGYYGKPVKYCLHMLKFNSRFNSKTGNFEISCQFIGYTYAMLSDMLVGYLKAISRTKIGAEIYKKYNEERGYEVIDLVELIKRISAINEGVVQVAATSESAVSFNDSEDASTDLDAIESTLNSLGGIDYDKTVKNKYPFIVRVNGVFTTEETAVVDSYKENVVTLIKTFNDKNTGVIIDENYFLRFETQNLNKGLYASVTREMFNPNKSIYDAQLKELIGSQNNFGEVKNKVYEYLKKYTIADNATIDVYNLNGLYEKIDFNRTELAKKNKTAKESLALELKTNVAESLGFEPTVRKIIEIFTTAIEVLMETIYTVSTSAERKDNLTRINQLETKFGNDVSDINSKNIEKKDFFAWPDYKNKDDNFNKYLGARGVLDNPLDVDELAFIDDLFNAFVSVQQEINDVLNETDENTNMWVPINPIDSNIFLNSDPYTRTPIANQEDIVRTMLIRGITFMGYTNTPEALTVQEIEAMALIESQALLRGITNDNVRRTLQTLTLDNFINSKGIIDGESRNVVKPIKYKGNVDHYLYKYIFNVENNDFSLIPISGNFNSDTINKVSWGVPSSTANAIALNQIPNVSNTPLGTNINIPLTSSINNTGKIYADLRNKASNGEVFLTNYSSNYSGYIGGTTSATTFYKADDGGKYIKILKQDEYTTTKTLYDLNGFNASPTPINLETIKKDITVRKTKAEILSNTIGNPLNLLDPIDLAIGVIDDVTPPSVKVKNAGFNCFAGPYGIQDLSLMNFGEKNIDGLPLMYVFYRNARNGLSFARKDSVHTMYDYKDTGNITVINNQPLTNKEYKTTKGKELHEYPYHNREFFNLMLKGGADNEKNKEITFPYLQQPYFGSFNMNMGSSNEDFRFGNLKHSFSLFGSKWYYLQDEGKVYFNNATVTNNVTNIVNGVLTPQYINCERYNKAMLFLNILPFIGNGINMDFGIKNGEATDLNNPEEIQSIKQLFSIKGGFVHAPRLWSAYVGACLWRLSSEDPIIDGDNIIGGGSGVNDPIVWKKDGNSEWGSIPERYQYFPEIGASEGNFIKITKNDLLRRLPNQVKNEFKKAFFDFVNGTDGMISWDSIREKLEIWGGSSDSFIYNINTVYDNIDNNAIDSNLLNPFINKDKYVMISPIIGGVYKENYLHLELKGGYGTNVAVTTLINAMMEEVIIANNAPFIWFSELNNNERYKIRVSKTNFEAYFNKVILYFKDQVNNTSSAISQRNEIEQQVFGTTNDDVIKLQLYRTCKNIHDKWLAGTTDVNNIIFQCGSENRSRVDTELAKNYGNSSRPRLIDSFRFISRSFRDIGDKLYINPLPINETLIENPNTSAYDAISSLLVNNNFDFIALPTFINFRDDSEVEAIFTPYANYTESLSQGICGPSFVCAYVGQKSQHLDYTNSDYPNDGFDLRCINGDIAPNVPNDFKTSGDTHEDPIGAFVVKYSQQNQNIFKDISLDQSEFSETDESLQIQEDISQKGSETNRTIAGQNLYNVYSVRSYTAEVEMMGNAMIQPMMYFQLDNIPMFHGAYMVTRVKHSIKPNHMSTNFTGVRIRYAETPLITAMDLYMSMIDSMDLSSASSDGGGKPRGAQPPIIRTIIENGGLNGNIASGNIYYGSLKKIQGINNAKLNDEAENRLIFNAIAPLTKMLEDWVAWMGTNGFSGVGNGDKKYYASITSMFRDYNKQVAVKDAYGSQAATPGTSPHGWGIAVDLQFFTKEGKLIENIKNTDSSFDVIKNPSIKWLYDNSYKYGFISPYGLRDKQGLEEHWHFEYHGTSAVCMMKNNPTIYGYTVIVKEDDLLPIVTNPKGIDGKRAVYTDCEYKSVKDSGDGVETVLGNEADYWSLVSICALENYSDNPQGMADVAQSIYNRLNTPNKPYGKTIKEIVTARNQFEPTKKNRSQWLLINDEKTAITAIKGSKGWDDEKAKNVLNISKSAIANTAYQNNSRGFINTRTEFLASNPKSDKAIDVITRTPKDKNNSFYWEYAGKSLIGQSAPNPPNLLT